MANKIQERVDEVFETAEESVIIEYWNEYCEDCNYPDNQVYENNSENLELVTGGDVEQALRMAFYGDYNPNQQYFKLDGYGNFVSSWDIFDLIDKTELSRWLYDKFEEEEEEEEEEE